MQAHLRVALVGLTVLALGGCRTSPPIPTPETYLSAAIGSPEAIVFRTERMPLDEGTAPDGTLTLADAVVPTLRVDPAVQSALARVRLAQAEATQAGLLPNPIVSVLVQFSGQNGSPKIDAGLTTGFIALLGRPSRVSAADSRVRAQTAEALGTVLDTIAQVKARYVAIQSLESLLPILDGRSALLGRSRDVATARLQAGEGTRLDVSALDAQALQLAAEVAERRLELTRERLSLSRLIGLPSPRDTTWKVSPWAAETPTVGAESDWIASALTRRPDIQGQLFELSALGAEVRLAALTPFGDASVGVGAERDPDWAVGPSLSVPTPLFDWGQGRRRAANARELEAEHALVERQRAAVEEVRLAFATLQQSMATARQVKDELIPLQLARRSDTENAFRAGLVDVTTLIIADQDLQTAQAKLLDLERVVRESLFALERAAGGPLPPQVTPATSSTEQGRIQ